VTVEPLAFSETVPPLSPGQNTPVEWWFVQGTLSGPALGRHHVMTAFFRVRGLDGGAPEGAMLLQHALEQATGRSRFQSRVTPETAHHHETIAAEIARDLLPERFRALAMRWHLKGTEAWARKTGIVVDRDGPRLDDAPFSVAWNGFAMAAHQGGLSLRIALATGAEAELTLSPQSAWLDARSEQLVPGYGPGFGYQCCPRLSAEGHVAGAPVTGQFWIDRQWGGYEGLLLTPTDRGYRMLGWDWLGLNLEDGRDLLLVQQRDPATGPNGRSFAILFRDGRPELCRKIDIRPARHWTSPRSNARYPVAWDLALPDLGLAGRVEPLFADQEIPVYGTTAIWEGAARFEGRSGSTTVGGRGRLELVGYGTALTLREHARRQLQRIANTIVPPPRPSADA
jgi:predicted secreted hydrolase